MSKRYFPQQLGDRKKAKLDISISDHNFPLSQNKEPDEADTWGDDNDDEILLLASQACEAAYNDNDISILPNYSMCMQPGSTSTQMDFSLGPSTSTTDFSFKKPLPNPPSVISTNLKEKYNRIASPLPGITASSMPKANKPENLTGNFIFNDKVYKGQDSDHIYQQLMQLQKENDNLKSENGKLLEKCVTKEGESSILRTQLKTCQVTVDNARLEKIKALERVQIEFTEKLAAANNEKHDLKTELGFKDLEIISVKERCKKLESSKVRLTQVTVANNDISSSYRQKSSFIHNDSMMQKKVKVSSNAVQTDNKAYFVDLNKTYRTANPSLPTLLAFLLEPTAPPHSLLDYNEKLTHLNVPYKCRVYSTFLRVPPVPVKKAGKTQLSMVYEDILNISSGKIERESYFSVFNATKDILMDVESRLKTVSQRMTTAFQKEMDEKYMETTSTFLDVDRQDLLKGGPLYKEEQEILARRMVAALSYVLECSSGAGVDLFNDYEQCSNSNEHVTNCIYNICSLLDETSTSTLHSGLLLSICCVIRALPKQSPNALAIIKTIISSRPSPAVSCKVVGLLREVSLLDNFRKEFCPGTSTGNLKMDYDQGVLLYKKENCHLQILLKQIEASLKCIESQGLKEQAVWITRQLMSLYSNLHGGNTTHVEDKSRCDCQRILMQVIVYALRICAVMTQNDNSENQLNGSSGVRDVMLGPCRCGVQLLYQCSLRDAEFCSQLGYYEGHLIEFCEIMRGYTHTEIYANMLSELAGTLQASPEDMPLSFHRQPWVKSFETFSMND